MMGVQSVQVDIRATKTDLEIFHHLFLQHMIAGIRRLKEERGVKERQPITWPILIRMLNTFDTRTLRGATLHTAFSFAFASFLYIGEFTLSQSEIEDKDFQQ